MVGAELKIFENLESQDRRKWRFQSLLYLFRHEEFPPHFLAFLCQKRCTVLGFIISILTACKPNINDMNNLITTINYNDSFC